MTALTFRRLLLLAIVTMLMAGCLEHSNPVHREIAKGLAYLLAAVGVAAVVAICFVLARIGHGELVWLLLGFISFLLVPTDIRTGVYSYFLAGFGFGSLVLVLLGELRADPPPFVKRLLGWFIALGLLLIIPWGIAFAFKYGLRPFFSVLAAPAERHLGFWNYAVWFVVKVVVLIGGSRLLDGWLEGRGRGVLARVTLRTLLIWGLGLVPFPHVFGSMWGDLLAAAAPSSMIDGVIDVLGESTSDDQIFAGVMLSIGVLLALPGTHALYADVLSPPLGIIISVAFASLASRVFFMQVKYGMLTSGQTITNNQSVASSWEDSGSDD